jgi:ketosteroid isomerase-like protein
MPEATTDDEVLTPPQLIERFRNYGLAFELEKEADLFASDGIAEWPMADGDHVRRIVGRDEIRKHYVASSASLKNSGITPRGFSRYTLHETTDPGVWIAEFEVEAELPNGPVVRVPYVQVFTIRDGRIALFRDYIGPQTAGGSEDSRPTA